MNQHYLSTFCMPHPGEGAVMSPGEVKQVEAQGMPTPGRDPRGCFISGRTEAPKSRTFQCPGLGNSPHGIP